MNSKRILVVGAGVIGSIYGGRLAENGAEVTFLARGKRLEELRTMGLRLQRMDRKNGRKEEEVSPPIRLIERLSSEDIYDYIFVTLRAEQVMEALPQLAGNRSETFVFMVNNAWGYEAWEQALGRGRVLPAFPGAGGCIERGIVQYNLVQRCVQPTTLGEVDGTRTPRLRTLQRLLAKAGFPTSIQHNMDAWQKTHLALVVPMACAIYYDGGDNYSLANNREALLLTSKSLRENLAFLRRAGIGITPKKIAVMRYLSPSLMSDLLTNIFASSWAELFIMGHTLKARGEMLYLAKQFLTLAHQRGFQLPSLQTLLAPLAVDSVHEPS